jgi:hypothetical protein
MVKKLGNKASMSTNWCVDTLIDSHKKQGKVLKMIESRNKQLQNLSSWRKWLIGKLSKNIIGEIL